MPRVKNLNPIIAKVLSQYEIEFLIQQNDVDKKIEALTKHAEILLRSGFSQRQLSKILFLKNGDKKLTVLGKYNFLLTILATDQLFEIVSSFDGVKNIEAIVSYASSLLKCGVSDTDLYLIVNFQCGYKNIQTLAKYIDFLLELKFSIKQLVNIVSRYHGYKLIDILVIHARDFLQRGFSNYQLVEILSFKTNREIFEILAKYTNNFLQLDFSIHQTIKIAFYYSRYNSFENLLKDIITLRGNGFSTTQLLEVMLRNVSYHSDGIYNNIELLAKYASIFLKLGFSTEQLIQLTPYCSNGASIKRLYKKIEDKKEQIHIEFPGISNQLIIDKLHEWLKPEECQSLVLQIRATGSSVVNKVSKKATSRAPRDSISFFSEAFSSSSYSSFPSSSSLYSAGSLQDNVYFSSTEEKNDLAELDQLELKHLYLFNIPTFWNSTEQLIKLYDDPLMENGFQVEETITDMDQQDVIVLN